MHYFKNLSNYNNYLDKYPLHKLLKIDLKKYGSLKTKINRSIFYTVNPNLNQPFTAELDDLIRLHFLILSRKVTTILEFGVGKSTFIIDHALQINKKIHQKFVYKNLRRTNPFQCFSIDNKKNG